MNEELLFVYGTLRQDTQSEMYQLLAKYADFVTEGTYQGRLYLVDYYPGVVPSDDPAEQVHGEVYALREADVVLKQLDQYEECGPGFPEPTEYVRRHETITLLDGTVCNAWIYVYNHPTENLVLIPSGDFIRYEAKQENPAYASNRTANL